MKYASVVILSVILLFSLTGFKPPGSIPDTVKEFIQVNYPSAEDILWFRENKDLFRVNMLLDKREVILHFKANGEQFAKEKQVFLNELPQIVKQKVQGKYHIKSIYEITNIYDEHFYIIEGMVDKARYDIFINNDGSNKEEVLMSDPRFNIGKYGMLIGLIFVII